MEKKLHQYRTALEWTGNIGLGTKTYKGYERSHTIKIKNKITLECSSDPSFNGDPIKYNPEELLLASVSSCHMLWYLHLCSVANIIVTAYVDEASGLMQEEEDGAGKFVSIELRPIVTLQDKAMLEPAKALHLKANKKCFIANSLNFQVNHNASFVIESQ